MSATSGQYGAVKIGSSCVAEADKWSLDKECTLHEYRTCSSPGNGGTGVVAGARKHSGSCEGIFDPADPIETYFDEGDSVTLKLYVNDTKYYQVAAVVEKLTIGEIDIAQGAPVRWSMTFKVHGLATYN